MTRTAPAQGMQQCLTVNVRALARPQRALSAGPLGTSQAQAIVTSALRRLWADRIGSSVPMPRPPVKVAAMTADARAVAGTLRRAVVHQGMPEVCHIVGTVYTANMDQVIRSERGAFFTPPALAQQLTDMANRPGVDWTRANVVDPAVGFGALLIPAVQMIKRRSYLMGAALIDHLDNHVAAFELDAFSGWVTRIMLSLTVADDVQRAGYPLHDFVYIGDALRRHTHRRQYSVVLANPPYGKVTLDGDLRGVYARSLRGHANLYGVFTDLCLRLAKKTGVVSLLVPTSFLAGSYFQALRATLRGAGDLTHLEVIEARSGVFEDVLQEAATMALKKVDPARRQPRTTVHVRVPGELHAVDIDLPADPSDIWIVPRVHAQVGLVRHVAHMPTRLSDYGVTVSTGPLVWNRHKEQLSNDWEAPAADHRSLPILWGEAVQNGKFAFRTDRSTHSRYIRLRPGQEHLVLEQPAILMQRTTSKEQHRRLICAAVPAAFLAEHGGAVVENHVNMLLPTRENVRLEAIARLLNTRAVDDVFRCMSGSVAVSAYELEALPLPRHEQLMELAALMAAGATDQEIEDTVGGYYWNGAGNQVVHPVLDNTEIPVNLQG